jgi:tetratricopeptide (TPR) repeat protein
MKTYRNLLLTLGALFCSVAVFAQTESSTKKTFNEGIALFDKGNFAEAAEKYKEVLKIDPNDYNADYELGFTYYRMGKPKDAIPYLEAILKSNGSKYETYDMLGSIYDEAKQTDKAIECFKAGIKEKPDFYRLHFNLAITYYETKKFAEAEAETIEALRLKPDHANSQRLYAMATYYNGKHINSLLAWCSFLMIEPQTQRSAEACNYIKHILYYSTKGNDITMHGTNEETNAQQIAIAISVTGGLTLAKAKSANAIITPLDSISMPLPTIFKIAAEGKGKYGPPFFTKYFVDYFGALANTNYMDAFVRYITISANRDENMAWLKAHPDDLKGLDNWLRSTKRETE